MTINHSSEKILISQTMTPRESFTSKPSLLVIMKVVRALYRQSNGSELYKNYTQVSCLQANGFQRCILFQNNESIYVCMQAWTGAVRKLFGTILSFLLLQVLTQNGRAKKPHLHTHLPTVYVYILNIYFLYFSPYSFGSLVRMVFRIHWLAVGPWLFPAVLNGVSKRNLLILSSRSNLVCRWPSSSSSKYGTTWVIWMKALSGSRRSTLTCVQVIIGESSPQRTSMSITQHE